MLALPFLVVIGCVLLWYIGTIIIGKSVGNVAVKLQEEFNDELVDEEHKINNTLVDLANDCDRKEQEFEKNRRKK